MPYPFLHIFYAENNFILNFLPLSASYQPKISIIFQFYFADKNKNPFDLYKYNSKGFIIIYP